MEENELALLTKQIRKLNGLSIRDVSRVSGLALSTISRIERGILAKPKIDTLQKLAKGLDIDERSIIETAGYVYNTGKSVDGVPYHARHLTDMQLRIARLVEPDASEEDFENFKKLLELVKLIRKD